jgi:hypothetical protein
MAIDNKYFNGGLNTDDEDRVLPNGDYRYALNIRNSKSDNDSQGSIENTKGNTEVSYAFGAGSFQVVGAYDDKINNKIYYFVWSSQGSHLLLEYDVKNNIINKVLETSLLSLDPQEPIISSNITIIGGQIYWVNNIPYKINISKAITGGYPSPIRKEHMTAIVMPPAYPPINSWESTDPDDPDGIKTNNVRGSMWQFRTKFVYEDNEESAWSPVSKVELPFEEGLYRPLGYYETTRNNYINVTFNTGNELVKRVKVAFRNGNVGDFYLAKDIDKSKIPALASTYTFPFYNNEVYTSIDNDGGSGMRLFDWTPLQSNTQSLIDGNRIAYGGITENYDPVDIDIEIEPVYSDLPDSEAPGVGTALATQSIPTGLYNIGGSGTWGQAIQTNTYHIGNNLGGTNYWAKIGATNVSTGIPAIYTHPWGAGRGFYDVIYLDPSRTPNGQSGGGLWVVSEISHEVYVYNEPNGFVAPGSKFVVQISTQWAEFGVGSGNRVFKFQETAIAGDTAKSVLERLGTQINGFTHTTSRAEVKLTASTVAGTFVRNFTTLVNGNKINISVEAYALQDIVKPLIGIGDSSIQGILTPIPALTYSKIYFDSYAGWTSNIEKTLKMGARHGIGMVYYDMYNRSTLANISDNSTFYVKYPTERGLAADRITDVVELDLTINHDPPSWASHYQIVYTGNQSVSNIQVESGFKGFLQVRLDNVVNSGTINGALQSELNNLQLYGKDNPEVTSLVYGFTKGDRIRFLKDKDNDYYQEYIDVEIISFDEGTNLLTFKKPEVALTGSIIAELYTPKKDVENDFYYEIGEVYDINNGYHTGNIQDQSATVPEAKIRLYDIGDVYLRYRESPMNTQVEDYNYSDFYDSDTWDRGRTYISDKNITQTYRPTTIRYSEAFIPETNINGLSQFNDLSFEAYDHKYGDIRLLYSEDKALLVFQQLKVGQIGVSQSTLYSNDGSTVGTVRNETKVLSDIRYYAGEFGIGNNPESFAVYGNMKYWADAKRGAILRLGGDGITPISEYKMHNYWTDKLQEIDDSVDGYKIYGVYDVRFDEYILHINSGEIRETIAYSEGKDRWTTFYSFNPDFMVSNRTGLITFSDGKLYIQNSNETYNQFYGLDYKSSIRFLSNVEPNKVKVFCYITQDSNTIWSMPTAVNQYEQETSLLTTDFEDVEGVYKTSFLRDANTPNKQFPLIEGDEMRSNSMDITLENDSQEFVKLFSVGVGVTLSELTNR